MHRLKDSIPKIALIFVFVALLIISSDWFFYEYYNLYNLREDAGIFQSLRFIALVLFVILAYIDYSKKDKSIFIIWIASALLINPFKSLNLGKEIWIMFDWIWIGILVITMLTGTVFASRKERV